MSKTSFKRPYDNRNSGIGIFYIGISESGMELS